MKEEFLHYLWKYKLYHTDKLYDDNGNKIVVISPGEYNRDSGPDFFNARIRIEETEWAGNVEIHFRSSQWYEHGHNTDPAYDNVILHIVTYNDKKVVNTRGTEIPASVISFDQHIFEKYISLINNPFVIACQPDIRTIESFYLDHWLSNLAVERLKDKSEHILNIFYDTGNDWDETFYRMLARYFGFRVNREPFGLLATTLPFRIIRKHSDNLFQIEALLFGTAGFLEEKLFREAINDIYYAELVKEYKILSSKYTLSPLDGWIWKFSRLRPANFPTVRIAQLAAILTITGGLFSKVIEIDDIAKLRKMFEVQASEYWDNHYLFGKPGRLMPKCTGSQAADIILINTVIPLLFVYGRYRNSYDICEKALNFLDNIDPESNSVVSEWESAGINAESALYSQALLQLKNNYCSKRRCLDCRIGAKIISSGKRLKEPDELILEP